MILVSWDGHNDPENPYNWSLPRKWALTALAVFTTFLTIMNGTIITVPHVEITEQFHVSEVTFPHSYWAVTTWAVGGACSSLLILPLTEDFGVRPVFLSACLVFYCFLVPQALAQNFATLVVTRFFFRLLCRYPGKYRRNRDWEYLGYRADAVDPS